MLLLPLAGCWCICFPSARLAFSLHSQPIQHGTWPIATRIHVGAALTEMEEYWRSTIC
eukprot:CAMPEP_0172161296 /NCGR_PEP_ID=MMETSP1050-20130122/6049_1 /TAXON_ID=233186 /ORGANISM="Cryptomonas curvata, Strain CCAP979/52" /LENGTH=57 /DNA_ID=CAMNT_0012831183 /DNA_START=85 /DNA_END=255 /DNA_ORIENTATION=-